MGYQNNPSYYQTTAPIQFGNSGGPLMDRSGNVIGIVTAKMDGMLRDDNNVDVPQNVNFAIKSSVVKNYLAGSIIRLEKSLNTERKDVTEIHDLATQFSVFIQCYK